jgi:hypothetical protein
MIFGKQSMTANSGGLIAPPSVPAALLLERGKKGPKSEPADHALGRSKGGFGANQCPAACRSSS